MNESEPFKPNDFFIVAVDDLPENLKLVSSLLRENGYRVSVATSGKSFLERLDEVKPDLVLLDLMMPEMDGLEVCERFKAREDCKDIPVVFLTSSEEPSHLVTAFECGAVDFVSKPFNAPELLARVRTHLELNHSRAQLKLANEALKELNAEKDEFMGIASHDLKNPLTSILGIAQLLGASPSMPEEKLVGWVKRMEFQCERMIYIIKNLLDANKCDQTEMSLDLEVVDMNQLVRGIYSQQVTAAEKKEQDLCIDLSDSDLSVCVDQNLMGQVLENLVSNAIKYSPTGKPIQLQSELEGNRVSFYVKDQGPGLSEEDQQKLFKRFSKLTPTPTGGEHSSGLGLSIVKRLVEHMGGEVWCRSELGEGSTFGVSFNLASMNN